jgi:hypothetical protein
MPPAEASEPTVDRMLGTLVTTPQPLLGARPVKTTKTGTDQTRHAPSARGTARSQREDKGLRIMPRERAPGDPGQGWQSGPATSVLWQVEFGGQVLAPPSAGVATAPSDSPASTAGATPESTTPASASVQAGVHVPGTPMF